MKKYILLITVAMFGSFSHGWGTEISGQTTESDAKTPLPDVAITVCDANGTTLTHIKSNEKGSYSLTISDSNVKKIQLVFEKVHYVCYFNPETVTLGTDQVSVAPMELWQRDAVPTSGELATALQIRSSFSLVPLAQIGNDVAKLSPNGIPQPVVIDATKILLVERAAGSTNASQTLKNEIGMLLLDSPDKKLIKDAGARAFLQIQAGG